jgi:chemotaxis protein MotB
LRRRPRPPSESHDRWLVSYADFITLLFAFFVVMFATAQSGKNKNSAKMVSASVRDAFNHGQMSAAIAAVLGNRRPSSTSGVNQPRPAEPLPDLAQSLEVLHRQLSEELKAGKMQLKLDGRGLIISLREGEFFASGDATVHQESYPIVEKVAAVVRVLPNPVRLEGHTDSIPIHTARFRSNWELSAARAIAMLELLSGRFGVAVDRMAVAGYAENAPADTNESEEGRAHNRRVDVVVLATDEGK